MAARFQTIGPHFFGICEFAESFPLWLSSTGRQHRNRSISMKKTLVRYKIKPESADDNQRFIEGVFRELHAAPPKDFRYLALRLEDGTFVHIKMDDTDDADPIHELDAFKTFQSGLRDRCVEGPKASTATVVGNYRMLGE
jgi:hypothetical protein